MAKDSVQKRLEAGLSFTEFSYQLVQGYDFYHLYMEKNCKLQMGGSDQWGNIVTGTELIRRKAGGEAYALTAPLITKSDGGKFGKTESGNVWLDKEKTSPYKFYQFWLNVSDEDAKKYIRIFTLLPKEKVESLEKEHAAAPHNRILQKAMARDITVRVHSEEDFLSAEEASQILFGKGTADALKKLSEDTLLSVFEGVPQIEVLRTEVESGIDLLDFLVAKTRFLSSNSEARRALKENSISVNQEKADDSRVITAKDLINGRYILLQRGKKNYFLAKVV
jgi:tyrosyl-tRNA synthetase